MSTRASSPASHYEDAQDQPVQEEPELEEALPVENIITAQENSGPVNLIDVSNEDIDEHEAHYRQREQSQSTESKQDQEQNQVQESTASIPEHKGESQENDAQNQPSLTDESHTVAAPFEADEPAEDSNHPDKFAELIEEVGPVPTDVPSVPIVEGKLDTLIEMHDPAPITPENPSMEQHSMVSDAKTQSAEDALYATLPDKTHAPTQNPIATLQDSLPDDHASPEMLAGAPLSDDSIPLPSVERTKHRNASLSLMSFDALEPIVPDLKPVHSEHVQRITEDAESVPFPEVCDRDQVNDISPSSLVANPSSPSDIAEPDKDGQQSSDDSMKKCMSVDNTDQNQDREDDDSIKSSPIGATDPRNDMTMMSPPLDPVHEDTTRISTSVDQASTPVAGSSIVTPPETSTEAPQSAPEEDDFGDFGEFGEFDEPVEPPKVPTPPAAKALLTEQDLISKLESVFPEWYRCDWDSELPPQQDIDGPSIKSFSNAEWYENHAGLTKAPFERHFWLHSEARRQSLIAVGIPLSIDPIFGVASAAQPEMPMLSFDTNSMPLTPRDDPKPVTMDESPKFEAPITIAVSTQSHFNDMDHEALVAHRKEVAEQLNQLQKQLAKTTKNISHLQGEIGTHNMLVSDFVARIGRERAESGVVKKKRFWSKSSSPVVK